MNKVRKDGSTLRKHLESIWRQTGRKPKELKNLIELPQSCYLVWKYFLDLNNARGSNGFSVNPISYTDIMNYFFLMDVSPNPEEVDLIRQFDNKYMEVTSRESTEK